MTLEAEPFLSKRRQQMLPEAPLTCLGAPVQPGRASLKVNLPLGTFISVTQTGHAQFQMFAVLIFAETEAR